MFLRTLKIFYIFFRCISLYIEYLYIFFLQYFTKTVSDFPFNHEHTHICVRQAIPYKQNAAQTTRNASTRNLQERHIESESEDEPTRGVRREASSLPLPLPSSTLSYPHPVAYGARRNARHTHGQTMYIGIGIGRGKPRISNENFACIAVLHIIEVYLQLCTL